MRLVAGLTSHKTCFTQLPTNSYIPLTQLSKNSFILLTMAYVTGTPAKSPKRVNYFSHFPHYFLRPYKGQPRVTLGEFSKALNTRNCEWMLRPAVALSELAQCVNENLDTITNTDILRNIEPITDKLQPLQQTFKNLDTTDKQSSATANDIYDIMSFAVSDDDELDNILEVAMQASSGLYAVTCQLMALRSLFRDPESFADRLESEEKACMAFKTSKNQKVEDLTRLNRQQDLDKQHGDNDDAPVGAENSEGTEEIPQRPKKKRKKAKALD
ncbi:predicted protein [Nematostella vectensis]|uniref:Uncharacterized protein n=1 Tax=Nematostella vectensis TaxID=45351 RepID=A7SXG4_NEMVE|nr:predicted protein [Nematostella vectensis]|eukprot:XP_001623704.1 predicted protein [Nematostella vectensis]